MAKKRIYNKTNIGDIVNGFLVLDAFIKNNVRWYKLKCLECDEVVESRSGSFRKHKACSCGGRAKTAQAGCCLMYFLIGWCIILRLSIDLM